MKVTCIGSSSKDIFFPISEGVVLETPEDLLSQKKITFELGAKYHVEDRYEALGGCAVNVACGLAKLGLDASVYTKIGDDSLGQWVLDGLRKENVQTDLIQEEKNILSDLSVAIVDQKSGERTIFCNRDANENLEIIPDKLSSADWIFVSALNGNEKESWEENLDKIIEAVSGKIKLVFNPGPENIKTNPQEVIKACKAVEILMVNKDEALEIVSNLGDDSGEKLNDEFFLIKELGKLGPNIITITDGMRGAWAYDGNLFLHADPISAKPIETTGAGDAYSSGFIAAFLKGKSLEEALKWGIINSGNSVQFYGAHEGLLSENQIKKEIEKVKVEIIK
jgi:ribokinase